MTGLGTGLLGTGPLGPSTPPATIAGVGPRYLDPHAATLGRAIDPRTGDYVLDPFGRAVLVSGVRQRVQLALSTRRGSAAVRWLGHDLWAVQDITDDFETRVVAILRGALQRLVAAGEIEILAIDVATIGPPGTAQLSGASIRVRWRDLTGVGLPEYTERVR